MPTIDGASPTNPAEASGPSPQRVPRITIFIHNLPDGPDRPAAVLVNPAAMTRQPSTPPRRSRGGRHQLDSSPWLDLAERILCSWPITLRVTVLLAVLLTGTAALAAALGIGGQLLLAALGLQARLNSRRRAAALRQRRRTLEAHGR